jgi:hypothetical protein
MGKIHCSTCTCEESSRPRTGEFTCPNCFRPNNSEGWLRWHLKNQCEVSPVRAREDEATYTGAGVGNPEWEEKYKKWMARLEKKTNMRVDPTRW